MSPRATRRTMFVVAGVVLSLAACKDLEGREGNRKGGRLFRESAFVDAAFEYEQALKKVNDPKIHYNLGLTYSKIFHPGTDDLILIGEQKEEVCNGTGIPGVVKTEPEICLKEGDRHYNECQVDLEPLKKDVTDAHDKFVKPQANLEEVKMVAERLREIYGAFHVEDLEPIDTWARLTSMGVKQRVEIERTGANMSVAIMTWFGVDDTDDIPLMIKDDDDLYRRLEGEYEGAKAYLSRMTCSSSFKCTKAKMCALTSRQVADLAVTHWLEWLNTTPDDRETRILMSKLWLQSQQHQKALDYWKGLLEKSPKDTKIMNNIAEIYQDAGEELLDQSTTPVVGWRAGMDWYRRVADASTDDANKVAALQYIGRVVWAKLNEKRLSMEEVNKLANIGLGALTEATGKQPNNTALWALQYSIWNYRSLAHGASWAGALDRATSQDLVRHMRVLNEQAKKAQATTTATPAEGGKSGS